MPNIELDVLLDLRLCASNENVEAHRCAIGTEDCELTGFLSVLHCNEARGDLLRHNRPVPRGFRTILSIDVRSVGDVVVTNPGTGIENGVGSPHELREDRVPSLVEEVREPRDRRRRHTGVALEHRPTMLSPFHGLGEEAAVGDGDAEEAAEEQRDTIGQVGDVHVESGVRGEVSEHLIIAHSANKNNNTAKISRIMRGERSPTPTIPSTRKPPSFRRKGRRRCLLP